MKTRFNHTVYLLFATTALLGSSCKQETTELGGLPVVTAELFSVEADAEQPNVIHFRFTGEKMSPYWEVQRSATSLYTTNEREFTLTYPRSGTYTGSLRAYGSGGLGEKHEFSFSVEVTTASEHETILMAHPWKIVKWGWCGEGWEYLDEPVPVYHTDDALTFAADRRFVYDPGPDTRVYNDDLGAVDYTPSDTWSWEVFDEEGGLSLQFGGGAFPAMQANTSAIDGLYRITEISTTGIRLEYWQESQGQYFVIVLAPADGGLPSDKEAILTAHPWKIGRWGWSGSDWEYIDDPVPDYHTDDVLTFAAGGRFTYDPGADARVYHDDRGAIDYTPSDAWTWQLLDADGALTMQFGGGAFPGMLADDNAADGLYTVREIAPTSVRLEFQQQAKDQNFIVILTPADEKQPSDEEAVLTANPWKIAKWGWCGDGWEYIDDPVPDYHADDVLTFDAGGQFRYNPGADPRVYNDDGEAADYTPSDAWSWRLLDADGTLTLQFGGGAFPGMQANASAVDGLYRVPELSAAGVRLEFWQQTQEQYFVLILTPADN